ncbi:hypothetical protein [Deinococcus peraridilitoris]|uniref:DUF8082 domain-containing protein n=1 Tax=Deinococcus peraridilitoris (strain DSM 19664 / LMG 22246 / CIP 109416 / KR-200) TaxID=937777 RepID=L0A5B7_DEIPD|nr:hypothetical protein [Deinococcus peraridilitoris]AFZ68609.1 hypothetical protein Deipe_3164 [Deinococcus peraridilitoris DSM 19664]
MNATSVPLPTPLQEDTMLPFALWRVADLINGEHSVAVMASQLGMAVGDVQSALKAIEQHLGLALAAVGDRATPVESTSAPLLSGEDLFDLVSKTAVELIGPVGEVIVEDAIDELGEDVGAADLILRVAQDLREPQRSAFLGRIRAKGLS